MGKNISALCKELNAVLGTGTVISLPNAKVTTVNVDNFLQNVLKTTSITFNNASVACEDSTITIKGDFILFGVQLSVNWGFTEEDSGTITWNFGASTSSASSISNMVTHFLSKTFDLPSGLSGLPVNNIGFQAKINTGDKNYSLDLTAKTTWGDVELFVKDNSGTWGAALGVGVSEGFHLSKITSELAIFDALEFSDSAVVISDFNDKKLKITGITGVVDGAEFKSTLAVNSNSTSSALPAIINELSKSLSGIPLEITIDLTVSGNFQVKAKIGKTFNLPGFSKITLSDVEMAISSSPISASLSGDLSLPIKIPANPDVNKIDVTGAISFTYADGTGTVQATLNSDTEIIEPFNFYGVTLEDVGVGLDVSFGVETGVGVTIEGAFLLGQAKTKLDEKFAITMEFTDDLPNPSLLYCATKNLSLPVIFDSVIDSGITLPSILSDFSFDELMFYWCDKAQVLPDGTSCQVGIGYNAAIDFWGFHTYSALMINQGSGISGQASVDPINLLNGNITLTGTGTGGHGVKAGGAYFDFDTTKESFDVSVNANILGIKEVINASVSPTALDISMNSDFGFLEDKLAIEFKNGGKNMSFDSSLSIGINCSPSISIGGVNLGTIKIDDSFNGTIKCSFENGTLSALVDAKFDFNGVKFGFNFDVGTSITDLANLATVIGEKVVSEAKSIFSSYFSDVTNYISCIGKGLLTGGDFIVNVLYHVYDQSITELFEVLAKLPTSFHVDGNIDFPIKIGGSIPSESVHVDLGNIVNVHADLHTDKSVFGIHGDVHELNEHADIGADKTITTPSFDVNILDLNVNQHFDMVMPPSVHVHATSPHISVDPHLDAVFVGGSLGVSGDVGVDLDVDLNNINLDAGARFNLSAHAGVHADLAGIGKHGDTSAHIDQAI